MRKLITFLLLTSISILSCQQKDELAQLGKHFQLYNDFESLTKAVELIPINADTSLVTGTLGNPIDMGFDYRYTTDSIGENGCVVGAVFHYNSKGKIDQKWVDEICE